MATKQEEIRNLATIYYALKNKQSLTEEIEKEEKRIRKQNARSVPTPKRYVPEDYQGREKTKSNERMVKAAGIISFSLTSLVAILSIIYAVIKMINTPDINGDGVFAVVFWWGLFYLVSLGLFVAFFLIKSAEANNAPEAASYIILSFTLLGALQFVFGGVCTCSDSDTIPWDMMTDIYRVSGVLQACALVLALLIYSILGIVMARKVKNAIARAAKKEARSFAAYEENRASAEKEYAEKKAKLAAEVQRYIAAARARIAEYKRKIAVEERTIADTPGLAMQDKNLYTVSTLLTYFERGKADSIKEAINLFDKEERDKARALEEHFFRERVAEAQRFALEKLAQAQRDHNEAVEAVARRTEERINRELDTLKDKRY